MRMGFHDGISGLLRGGREREILLPCEYMVRSRPLLNQVELLSERYCASTLISRLQDCEKINFCFKQLLSYTPQA